MPWWRRKRPTNLISISDPLMIELFGMSPSYAGVSVSELSALGVSAVNRAVSLISGTVASLPMRTLRDVDGTRTRVNSFLDDPGAPAGLTAYQWKETVLAHLLLHGNSYLQHVVNGAGSIMGLTPFHPHAVSVEWADVPGGKRFTATLIDGKRVEYDATSMTQIMAMSLDGLRGLSPIEVAKNGIGTSIAADRAAAKMFANGALFAGLVSAEEDVTEDEVKAIKESLDAKMTGWENSSAIVAVNRRLKFQPWQQTNADSQFLESRAFMIQEVGRIFGVPPHLLMDPGAVSTWGTGVEIMNRSLARYGLSPWTSRIEQALSRLLPTPRFVEFDYSGLLQPSPEVEIPLLIQQVQAGLMTVNEARRIRNMDPIDGGDVLRGATQDASSVPADEEVPA